MTSITIIRSAYKILKTLKGDAYYTHAEVLSDLVREFVRNEGLHVLNKKDLLMMCAIESSLRPYQPHIFLGYLSDAYDKEIN